MTGSDCQECGGTTICNNCEADGKPCDECQTSGLCPACNSNTGRTDR